MEYNRVAAKWWADKLRYVSPTNFDNGDNSKTGAYTMMLATVLALDSETSLESIDLFEEKLANKIKEHVEAYGSLTLSVDYAPDDILSSIAYETNVCTNGFPWKTTMWIREDDVSVSSGYAVSIKNIFIKS